MASLVLQSEAVRPSPSLFKRGAQRGGEAIRPGPLAAKIWSLLGHDNSMWTPIPTADDTYRHSSINDANNRNAGNKNASYRYLTAPLCWARGPAV